jgi:hypothetical protein
MPPRVVDQLAREARRRAAVNALKLAESIARYGAEQVADGLGPAEAARAVIEAADALEHAAARLRRLTRPGRIDPAERRLLAARLAASGLSLAKGRSRPASACARNRSGRTYSGPGGDYPGSPR